MRVTEWCPHCEDEVELEEKFERQECPNCKEKILPCAQCVIYECSRCPLEKEVK